MKIDHVIHNLNAFGGAEEHLTTLASLQRAHGHDVSVCLIQAANSQNQYLCRLRSSAVRIRQWPVWLSRVSGDWDTTEAILRHVVRLLHPAITVVARGAALWRRQPVSKVRPSVEGRVRTISGRILRREHQFFMWLLAWHHHWHRPDVVHLHSYGRGLDSVIGWCRRRGLPVVYQEHSTPDRTPRRSYAPPGNLRDVSLVVGVSEASAEALRQVCGVTRAIRVIPPIVGLDCVDARDADRCGRTNSSTRVVTIARLSQEKGLDSLIRAAERVVARRPHVTFLIYGDGYLREELTEHIERAGLGAHVRLAGPFSRADLPAIMRAADVFVLPSITEGYPLCLVEAMAWALPIVATDVGGVSELLRHGVTGLLCPAGDPAALGDAIMTLADDPIRARALGTAAQTSYHATLNPERVVTLFGQAYLEALQVRREAEA